MSKFHSLIATSVALLGTTLLQPALGAEQARPLVGEWKLCR